MTARGRSHRLALFLLLASSLVLVAVGCSDITLTSAPVPTIMIEASPSFINVGASATLTVRATNATSVSVAGSDGSSYSLPGVGGSQMVTPAATTTYTATALGKGGTATAVATVTTQSVPAPTVNIVANPSSVSSGASSTLTVTATSATSLTLSGTDGTAVTLPAAGGTEVVTPAVTTNYTALAIGPSGRATATATVAVTPSASTTQSGLPAANALSSAPVTRVFIATSADRAGEDKARRPAILSFDVNAAGQLKQTGTLLLPAREKLLNANSRFLFTTDGVFIRTYPVTTDGSLENPITQIETQWFSGCACCTVTGASFLDRSGNYLTMELQSSRQLSASSCRAWQTYEIAPDGQLTFLGALEDTPVDYGSQTASSVSGMDGTNQFAYGVRPIGEEPGIIPLRRTSAGDWTWNSQADRSMPQPSADNFKPLAIASDLAGHLAMVSCCRERYPVLATFTINNASGAVLPTNARQNAAKLPFPCTTLTVANSPAGDLIGVGAGGSAVLGCAGLQLYRTGMAGSPEPSGPVLLPNEAVRQLAWDTAGHLFVLSTEPGRNVLHVFTTSATSFREAQDSPHEVEGNALLVVVLAT